MIHLHGELMKVCSSRDVDDTRYHRLLTADDCEVEPGTLAGDGSLLLDESGRVHTMGVCRGTIISSVGAGDSMLAGFISGYISSGDHAYAHKLATACGGAAAFSCGTPKRELISTLLTQL